MKRVALLLIGTMLLCSCNNVTTPASTSETEETTLSAPATTSRSTAVTTTTATIGTATELPPQYPDSIWNGELPTMDGSTSAIPLETGIKAKLLGIKWAEAKELVSHTKTHIAFGNLLNGETNLIFSVPISQEQQAQADEMGVKLTFTPVAKEGFVFVVNADNPVDSLTQEQLRAIYSGEINNWKELGGNDEPITAFQRNPDSGSQNYMTEFMGETPLSEAPTELVAGDMGGILAKVASFDYGTGAIGYSVYSYAAQMSADRNEIKLVAVDGVKPTKATMADNSYPLSSCTYIITTDTADENTRDFVSWAVSDEGQKCVLESGYLPVNDMEIPADYLPYEAVGTGRKKPENYLPDLKYSYAAFNSTDELLSALADEHFKSLVAEDIAAATAYFTEELGINPAEIRQDILCQNGYLEVFLGRAYDDDFFANGYTDCKSLVYDIIEGKKIEKYSDLFFEGERFVPVLNTAIQSSMDNLLEWYGYEMSVIKNDFSGLTGTPECFGYINLCFNKCNPYSISMLDIYPDSSELLAMNITSAYRDMTECFVEGTTLYEFNRNEFEQEYYEKDGFIFATLKSVYHTEQEMAVINEKILSIQTNRAEFLKEYIYPRINEYRIEMVNKASPRYYDNYVHFLVETAVYDPLDMMYDFETEKLLTPQDFFGENWKSLLTNDIECDTAWISAMSEDDVWVSYIGNNGKIQSVVLNKSE